MRVSKYGGTVKNSMIAQAKAERDLAVRTANEAYALMKAEIDRKKEHDFIHATAEE